MSFLFKFAVPITAACAGIACIACSVNLGMYVNNIYIKKTGKTKTTDAEKYMTMVFCCIMVWELIGHFIFKKISGS
jgi:hypothetical protein